MNCEDFQQEVSQGMRLTPSAEEHLQNCSSCQAFAAALSDFNDAPDVEQISSLKDWITRSMHPARPLPSNWKMTVWALAFFALVSGAVALPFGHRGFDRLSNGQRSAYFSTIAVLAIFLTFETIQQMVPGARRLWNRWLTPLLSLGALSVLIFSLFSSRKMAGDVAHGLPCLELGLFSSAVGGVVVYLLVRKGYLVSPAIAGLITGLFAGLSGVTVLAIHCPVLDAGHVIVWHLGAMLLAGITGAVLASAYAKR